MTAAQVSLKNQKDELKKLETPYKSVKYLFTTKR